MHKKIKEVTGSKTKRGTGLLKDNQNNIIIDNESKLNHWVRYISQLYEDQIFQHNE